MAIGKEIRTLFPKETGWLGSVKALVLMLMKFHINKISKNCSSEEQVQAHIAL